MEIPFVYCILFVMAVKSPAGTHDLSASCLRDLCIIKSFDRKHDNGYLGLSLHSLFVSTMVAYLEALHVKVFPYKLVCFVLTRILK